MESKMCALRESVKTRISYFLDHTIIDIVAIACGTNSVCLLVRTCQQRVFQYFNCLKALLR